jgi:hypothetical protein
MGGNSSDGVYGSFIAAVFDHSGTSGFGSSREAAGTIPHFGLLLVLPAVLHMLLAAAASSAVAAAACMHLVVDAKPW